MKSKIISLIVPCFNEQDNIQIVTERILEQFKNSKYQPEIIFVDNNSQDNTVQVIRDLASKDSRVKMIRFSRNFGPSVESSIFAGYQSCIGEAAIVIYSDLQDPPELIPDFIDRWEAGYDVVNAVQIKRIGEPIWRRALVKVFYKLLASLSENPMQINTGDFKLISRKVIDQIIALPERGRFNRGLVAWAGFRVANITYERAPRLSGKSKANFFAIFTTALNGITSFSLRPLKLLTFFGFLVTLFSIFLSFVYLFLALTEQVIPGLSTITILLLVNLGLTMLAFGVLGEYVGRIHMEVKQRPHYIVSEKINI